MKSFFYVTALFAMTVLLSCEEQNPKTHVIIGNSQFTTQEAMDLNSEGIQLVNTGDIEGAKSKFQEGLNFEPSNATLLGNLGNCAMTVNDNATAKSFFLQSIQADSNYLNSVISYASILYDENNDSSVYWNKIVLRKSNDNAQLGIAHLRLGYVAYDHGNCDEAKSHYDLALSNLKSAGVNTTDVENFGAQLENCK